MPGGDLHSKSLNNHAIEDISNDFGKGQDICVWLLPWQHFLEMLIMFEPKYGQISLPIGLWSYGLSVGLA